jgi:ankyrin repeat protein
MRTMQTSLLALVLASAGLGAAAPDTRIVDAAEKKDAQAVLALMRQGADVNVAQGDGGTALHWAAHWDDVVLAKRLLGAGAHVNSANDYGVTPLFIAAANGNAEMVGVLLDAGADSNAALPSGETVLMTAVKGGNNAAIKRLLAKGANPKASQASKGQTALMWAATAQNVDIVKTLLEAGADITATSKAGSTALHFAAREGSIGVARALLAAGTNLEATDKDGSTPLLIATVRGQVDLALFLLEQGANPEGHPSAGYTPLHWAVGEYEMTPITYADIQAPGEWGSITGIPDRAKKFALVKALLARGADINALTTKLLPQLAPLNGVATLPHSGFTPFFNAAASADAEMMRFLLANGANPSIPARDGFTPLMVAAEGIVENSVRLTEERRVQAIEMARASGIDIEGVDRKGWRAMHVAAFAGFHKVITQLLADGADLNPKTNPTPAAATGLGNVALEPQTPRGLVEGTIVGIFQERPATAAFLASLGAKSEGAFNQNAYEENERKSNGGKARPSVKAP